MSVAGQSVVFGQPGEAGGLRPMIQAERSSDPYASFAVASESEDGVLGETVCAREDVCRSLMNMHQAAAVGAQPEIAGRILIHRLDGAGG